MSLTKHMKNVFFAISLALIAFPINSVAHPHDDEPEAKYQPAPIMPPQAMESGYCCMLLDIDKAGQVSNVRAKYCTHDYYKQSSLNTAKTWEYKPLMPNGLSAQRNDHKAYVSYIISDQFGRIIPSAEYNPNPKDPHSTEKSCEEYLVEYNSPKKSSSFAP